MRAYRLSVNLKLGLVVFAVLIAVASLLYTHRLVDRLRERERFIIGLWAHAQEQLAAAAQQGNPHLGELRALEEVVRALPVGEALTAEERNAYLRALTWARSMPPPGEVNLAGEIIGRGSFGVPAVIIDSSRGLPVFWQNVPVPPSLRGLSREDSLRAVERLRRAAAAMAEGYPPISIEVLDQYIFYDESRLIKELRVFPYLQLLFVGLFILVGYLGFSYVRRSEQGSLWVGMAKEAAHQLGTPISSLMGWHQLLKTDLPPEDEEMALEEIGKDIDRLRRVTSRFSDIGSLPKLEVRRLAPVVEGTADYMRRRIPSHGKRVALQVDVPPDLQTPLNAELFEWVVENLLKNALDAIEANEGTIEVTARRTDGHVHVDIRDTGKGIDRRQWKNIFRPGYSTKKRGWGLGLSLAKRIVEDYHGGTLSVVQSRVGYGTTFRIELPTA